MSDQLPQLHMRHTLGALPAPAMPAGYEIRRLTSCDVEAWATLLSDNGELGEWSPKRAVPFFATDSDMPLDGSFFITRDDEPVATAQLHLHSDDEYSPMPELGWVAVSPRHRRRGLGRTVCLAVLRHAAYRKHQALFLKTDDHRLPAIRTYMKLGFQPWMYDPSARERWERVLVAMDRQSTA